MAPIYSILFLLQPRNLAEGGRDAVQTALAHAPALVVLGFDGADYNLVNSYLEQGLLPHLAELRRRGGFSRLEPTNPPQTPVSWSTFATGLDPGQTGIQDFIERKPGTYLPQYALQGEGRSAFLFGRRNAFLLPLIVGAGFLVLGATLSLLFRRRLPAWPGWSLLGSAAACLAAATWYAASRYLPESVPTVHTVRLGEPLWSILSKAGKKSTIVRLPVTFPAEPLNGRMVAGLPTPDIRGTIGKPTIYTNDPFFQSGDNTFSVEIRILGGDAPYRSEILGPANKLFFDDVARQEAERMGRPYPHVRDFSAALEIQPGPPFTLKVQGQTITLAPGQWSPYVTFRYQVNPLITLKGFGRFYLEESAPFFKLYLGPINLHPDLPLPLSYPKNLAGELFEADPYETIGWAIDTWSISSGLMDEQHFLADLDHTVRRYEQLLNQLLASGEDDFYLQVFSFTDLIGHILMRFMDAQHPLHEPQKAAVYQLAMQQAYQRMDAIVGRLMNRLDLEKTTLIVCSDHGFASFRRQFNLNTYLVEQGYLVLKRNVLGEPMQLDDLQTGSTPFQHVDWSRTRAYAMGLGMVFLNVKGREPQGIVAEAERLDLAREIAWGLQNYEDEQGQAPIRRVYLREELYSSFDANTCADLRVANAGPYRVSWDTTLGGMPLQVVEDNLHNWSGDHCSLDPEEVPGILFSSIPLASWVGDPAQTGSRPAMIDMCPSLLALLGLEPPKTMRGRMLFAPR
jgi:predicted AlkP superfamily phosphohydrolase/phosphomutase